MRFLFHFFRYIYSWFSILFCDVAVFEWNLVLFLLSLDSFFGCQFFTFGNEGQNASISSISTWLCRLCLFILLSAVVALFWTLAYYIIGTTNVVTSCFALLHLLVLCLVCCDFVHFKQYIYTLCYFSLKLNFFFALNLFR